jgi:hypothetical protein
LPVQLGNIVRVLHESRRLHDLQRIDRGRQNNGDERVGMQRDGLDQFLEIRRTSRGGGGGRRGSRSRSRGLRLKRLDRKRQAVAQAEDAPPELQGFVSYTFVLETVLNGMMQAATKKGRANRGARPLSSGASSS